ncbi:hypothetical protein D9611_012964 [Ephemerocybe angulata]|uniref:Uncharacterized protein n=1 Tax=Ephemerocybe angulata TaxID=980116 RepID=A0A8H5C408_9AGAR|nr:hypothetical protein D9611_012964 [Tulosesus angulatus]
MAASVNHASAGSAFLEERQQRQKRLREIVRPDDPTTWDNAWKEKITPWDMGAVQPSLKEVIEESGIAFPQTGRALVPGCGTVRMINTPFFSIVFHSLFTRMIPSNPTLV